MENITEKLNEVTIINSNFEDKRDYISLSNIYKPVDELISDYMNGYTATDSQKIMCYKGYQMEDDLISRLIISYPNSIKTGHEISIENGLIKGHPDFLFNTIPGDIKSVALDEWIPKDKFSLPKKVLWQIQAYMYFMESDKGIIIYESRQSGIIKDFLCYRNTPLQKMIGQKIFDIIQRVIE